MTPLESSEYIEKIGLSKVVFIRCTPEIPDFTKEDSFLLQIQGGTTRIAIDVTPKNISTVIFMLNETIFIPNKVVLTWNFKPLLSYFSFFIKKLYIPKIDVLDLKVIGNFLGFFDQKPPENLIEAVNISKKIGEYKNWKLIYKKLHLPLIYKTLPSIETTPVHNTKDKTRNYSYYEIEGQKNGRLLNHGQYQRSFLPHYLGPEQREILRPSCIDDFFMISDINHCEVSILQKLSGDQKLGDFLESGIDVYHQIYELLTGDLCNNEKKRKVCKLVFLPTIYGCGVKGICENIGVNEATARDLIKRIHHYFKSSIDWVTSKSDIAKEKGQVEDFFGRIRFFNEEDYYRARNLVVQAPAATICLEKLILINDQIQSIQSKVLYTVHDGYGILCKAKAAKETHFLVKKIIQEESSLMPGLFLSSHSQFGKNLNKLKTLLN